MQNNFIRTKLFKVILVVAVFGLLVFLNPGKIFNPVRSFYFGITYPFQKSFYFVSYKTSQISKFFSSIGNLKQENERLIGENQGLVAKNAMLNDMKKENTILRSQLELAPRGKFNLQSASIIGQDPNGLGSWIVIDKGEKDGIRKNMPVIVSDGILVGKIDETYFSSSKVILITNPQSSVNAVVSETEAKGIVRGEFGLGLILDMVLQTDVIQKDDEVITSGIGGDVPRGLVIGRIQEIYPSQDKLFQQAVVTPLAKFSKLRLVFVIKN